MALRKRRKYIFCFGGKNKSSFHLGAHNHTTQTQVIAVLKELRSLLLPGVYEIKPIDKDFLTYHLNKKLESAALDLCAVVNNALVRECLKNVTISLTARR